jgi:hypothetical protein
MHATTLVAVFALLSAGLINAYDPVKMLCLVNKERTRGGLKPLGMSKQLENSAQKHSDDQARMRSMTHDGSDGSSPGDRVERAGYNWRSVAENVAYGYGDEEECMKEWMNSPGHRENIMGNSYSHFGSAVAYAGSTPYYTQDFGGDGKSYNFPECPSGGDYGDTGSSGGDGGYGDGGSAPSDDYGGGESSPSMDYGGSSPSNDYGGSSPSKSYGGGGSSPSKSYGGGGSSPSKSYGGGGSSPSKSYGGGGSSPSGGKRHRHRKGRKVTAYGGDVSDSNDTKKDYGGDNNNDNSNSYDSDSNNDNDNDSNHKAYGGKKKSAHDNRNNTHRRSPYGSHRGGHKDSHDSRGSYGKQKPSGGHKGSYGAQKPSGGRKGSHDSRGSHGSKGGAYGSKVSYGGGHSH